MKNDFAGATTVQYTFKADTEEPIFTISFATTYGTDPIVESVSGADAAAGFAVYSAAMRYIEDFLYSGTVDLKDLDDAEVQRIAEGVSGALASVASTETPVLANSENSPAPEASAPQQEPRVAAPRLIEDDEGTHSGN